MSGHVSTRSMVANAAAEGSRRAAQPMRNVDRRGATATTREGSISAESRVGTEYVQGT